MQKRRFVNVKLSNIQMIRHEDYSCGKDDWSYWVTDLVLAGHKVSILGNMDEGSVAVFISDNVEGSINSEFVLSCWGASLNSVMQPASIVVNYAHSEGIGWEAANEKLSKASDKDVESYRRFVEWERSQRDSTGG